MSAREYINPHIASPTILAHLTRKLAHKHSIYHKEYVTKERIRYHNVIQHIPRHHNTHNATSSANATQRKRNTQRAAQLDATPHLSKHTNEYYLHYTGNVSIITNNSLGLVALSLVIGGTFTMTSEGHIIADGQVFFISFSKFLFQ
jgi:hypothetical protein